MTNTKTYYSVTYATLGRAGKSEAWFDSKEEAKKFAAHDYRDDVVAHRVSRTDTMAKYDELVNWTALELAN